MKFEKLLVFVILGMGFVVACGGGSPSGDDPTSPECAPGSWNVVTEQDRCSGPSQTVSDTCVVLDDPVSALEEMISTGLFPDDCEPVVEEGVVSIDCQVEMPLESLYATLVDSTGIDPFPGVDFSGCVGTISISGGGTYTDDRFDYEFRTWAGCSGDCSAEALLLVCVPLESAAGSENCPTVVTMSGRLR